MNSFRGYNVVYIYTFIIFLPSYYPYINDDFNRNRISYQMKEMLVCQNKIYICLTTKLLFVRYYFGFGHICKYI